MTAADETRKLVQAVAKARDALRYFDGRTFDGNGEPNDPSLAQSALHEAAKAIEAAQHALQSVRAAGLTQHDN